MAFKIVQTCPRHDVTGAASTTSAIALKSGYVRVATGATAVSIDIGGNPSVTEDSFRIPTQSEVVLKERVARQKIAGITTGTTTVITLPENAGNPFLVGDYVTIENASGISTTHNIITALTDSSITVSYNSTSISASGIGVTNATVARSVKIAALSTSGSTQINIVEVQIASQA